MFAALLFRLAYLVEATSNLDLFCFCWQQFLFTFYGIRPRAFRLFHQLSTSSDSNTPEMAEKKPRRPSLIESLRILGKSPFTSHQHKDAEWDSKTLASPPSAGGTTPRKLSWPSIGRSSTRTVSDSYRSTISTTSTQDSMHIPDDHDAEITFPKPRLAGTNSRTRLLSSRTQRFSSSSSHASSTPVIPPAQASMPCLNRRWSRLPTPSNPPDGAVYSNEVYKKEGRRSVRSSIGKSLRRSLDRAGKVGGKRGDRELVPPHGKFHDSRKLTSESDLRTVSLGIPYQSHGTKDMPPPRRVLPRVFSLNTVGKASSRLRTMIPLPKSGSMFSLHSVGTSDTRQSPSLNGANQITAPKRTEQVETIELDSEDHESDQEIAEPQSDRKRPSLRKVRTKLQSLSGLQRRQSTDDEPSTNIPPRELANAMSEIKDEVTPKKWSQGLSSFRPKEMLSPGAKMSRSEDQLHAAEPKRQIKTDISQIPLPAELRANRGRGRRPRDPTERMVRKPYASHPRTRLIPPNRSPKPSPGNTGSADS